MKLDSMANLEKYDSFYIALKHMMVVEYMDLSIDCNGTLDKLEEADFLENFNFVLIF